MTLVKLRIIGLKIRQANQFKKSIKKFPNQIKLLVDAEVRKIAEDPFIGEQKKGDLDFLRVHKFKVSRQQYLLGYTYQEDIVTITLLKLSPHENFYRDIKR